MTLQAQEIAQYLADHPDFFDQHPELLSGMQLPHPHNGQAISLVERQSLMLRERIKSLEMRVAEMVRFARAAGEAATAVRLAHALMAAPADIVPDDLYPGERWLAAAMAHAAAGDAVNANAVQAAGAAWVRQTAAQQVPELCRESFLHRHPVNVALLAGPRALPPP